MKLDTIFTIIRDCETQGIKPGKVLCKRYGMAPNEANVAIAAARTSFHKKAAMFIAATKVAHSCMAGRPAAYANWGKAYDPADGSYPIRVAIYRNARALVRNNTRTFSKTYGEDCGYLEKALILLGYTSDVSGFDNGLVWDAPVTAGPTQTIEFDNSEQKGWVKVEYWANAQYNFQQSAISLSRKGFRYGGEDIWRHDDKPGCIFYAKAIRWHWYVSASVRTVAGPDAFSTPYCDSGNDIPVVDVKKMWQEVDTDLHYLQR